MAAMRSGLLRADGRQVAANATSAAPPPRCIRVSALLFLHKFMDNGIDAVGNPYFACLVDRDRLGLTELPRSRANLPRRREHLAVEIQAKNLPGESVHHINVLIANLKRTRQSGVLHFPDVVSVLIKDLNSLIFTIGDPKSPMSVDGNPM